MATVALTLPKTRRRLRSAPTGGRATFPDFYFVKQIDNSRLVREVNVERRRELLSLFGLGVLVFSFCAAVRMAAFSVCSATATRLNSSRPITPRWKSRIITYRLEQAALADPQRIDTLARTQLGMVTPNPQK